MSKKTLKEMQAISAQAAQTTKAVEASVKVSEELNETLANINKTFGKMVDNEEKVKKGLKEAKNETVAFADKMDDVSAGFSNLKGVMKGTPGSLKETVKWAAQWGEKMKGVSGLLGKAGGLIGGLAKSFGPTLIAVEMVWSAIKSVDSYVKNLNKRFAEIRGPEIMGKDVKKQMKEFNSAIFNISSNLRDGLNSKQVYEFFDAINAAGQRITTLNQGFYSYRDAVHVAAKASKVFGMSLDATARYMASFGTDYQMQLEDIDDAFVQVAFDAQKSGLSTDRFWTAVTNASASLSFYGKFLKEASNTMKAFTDAQVTGADEAAQTTGDLLQLFKKTSTQGNMAFAAIAQKGGSNLKKLFKNAASRADEEAAQIKEKIQVMELENNPEQAEALDKLRKQLVAAEQRSARATHAMTAGAVAQGQDLAMLAGETPELMLDLISGINGLNLSTTETGESQLAAIKGVEKLTGMSEGSLRTIIMSAQAQVGLLKQGLTADTGLIQGLNSMTKIDGYSAAKADALVKGIDELNQDSSSETLEKVSGTMAEMLGMDKDIAKTWVDAASVNEQAKNFLEEQLKLAQSGKPLDQDAIMAKYDTMIKMQGNDVGKDMFKKQLTTTAKANAATKKSYDETFQKLTDNTLSLDDMQKIITEGAGYQLASLAKLQDISAGITSLVRWFVKEKPGPSLKAQAAEASLSPEAKKELSDRGGSTSAAAVKYVKQKQESSQSVMGIDSVLQELSGIREGVDISAKKTSWMKKLEEKKKSGGVITKAESEMTNYLDELSKSSLKGKDFATSVAMQKKKMIEEKVAETAKLQVATDSLSKLNTIDESSESMATLMAADLATSPEKQEALYMLMKKQADREGKNKLDWAGQVKAVGQLNAPMMQAIAKKHGEFSELTGNISWGKASLQTPEPDPNAKTTPAEQKKDVRDVITPGSVYVSKGDRVVDKDSLAQVLGGPPGSAIPTIKGDAVAAGGTVPGAGGNKIEITVNATEKDLASRIANEIKGALYQLNVVGR